MPGQTIPPLATDDIGALKSAYDGTVADRATMERRRNERHHELMDAAKTQVARQLAEEFPDWKETQAAETAAKLALEDARIAAGKERLERLNYGRGILVEWDIKKNNWHSDRRHWYYRTGRRGILQVWDRESEYPDNIQHGYALPNYGDFYIRLIKKDGAPSRQFYKFSSGMAFSDQIIPNSWLPGDYKHEKAAPNEPDNWLVEFNGRRVAKR